MTTALVSTRFGQQVPASNRLDVVARSIVSAIGDGIPAAEYTDAQRIDARAVMPGK